MKGVDLPVQPPLEPMLAKAQTKVPTDAGVWSYEPKWDGFRALVFRDGDKVVLQSRNGRELGRYFPELLDALRAEVATRCVLDGEVVVPRDIGGRIRLDWESLSQRIHPATSRITMLAQQTPAHFIGFDALATGSASLLGEPLRIRRRALSELVDHRQRCHVTGATEDPQLGQQWLTMFEGAGLDGVVAKRLDGPYLPGKRDMVKVKHARDADCVAIGYRIHKSGQGIGSILLGLYRDDGELQMVGGAASFTAKDRLKLLADLEPLRKGADVVYDGEPSRWNSAADKRWIPIRPEKVAEVAYDQMEGQRFRHAAHFVRWRPDRDPTSCTFDQLDVPATYDLYDVLES
ncbi:ATP-dependent DNA ligase [Mycobacterium heckeshornense]|uniref:DNA ligase (ATP) n=1 Tax=Mycobacterium heckeshornense TaxID=110505 RepID=A0A2I3ERL7_9MYCO|nr:ATP-dependent DNA ligase [Mycobacterium heckeshornense]KMV22491.1 ATP-dependent DNA ligase [Mycobacterium heckeshornense]MCV7034569.1 ATP-dependent DNA ligase [Mycobacterium heckeshornense]BCO33818.1 DNA ligase C1 [Mycobacterium heckeshornense]